MKKEYMKPVMRIVLLQQQCQILAGSEPASQGLENNPEELIWDPDDLDEDDDLR